MILTINNNLREETMNNQNTHTNELWTSPVELNWKRCSGDAWCRLNTVNLDHEYFAKDISGVYIIWHGGTSRTKSKVVYIGQGNIKDRIIYHRENPEVQEYAQLGLYVTWARVTEKYRDHVEAYLVDKWDPIVGERYPEALPIKVNSPW